MVQKWFTEFRCGQLSVWSIFCIQIYAWESSVQDGCSQSIKNAFVWLLRRKIWPILTIIRKSFCIDLWLLMKHRSTTILRNHVEGQNSRLNLVKVHQSVRKRNNRLEKLWLVFFGMHMDIIDYLEKGRTITGAYYTALLDRLIDEIK